MTDDELRAMAMKVVAMTDAEEARGCNLFLEEKAANALGRAWLAEHPADDGEAIDAGWLEAVGVRMYANDSVVIGYVRHPELDLCVEFFHDGRVQVNGGIVLATTRGAVRRLCAALGVELKGAGS
jgi:hypothetical protein